MAERKRKVASPQVMLGRFKYGSDSTFVEFMHEQGQIYDSKKRKADGGRTKAVVAKKAKAAATKEKVLHLRQEALETGKSISVKRIAKKAGTSPATVYRIFEKAGYGKYKRESSKKDLHI
jgi:DNA invertase Pin-like site-specific DNA recombinase